MLALPHARMSHDINLLSIIVIVAIDIMSMLIRTINARIHIHI